MQSNQPKAPYRRLWKKVDLGKLVSVSVTKRFGQNVQKLRFAANLTQEQLSEFADIDRSFVQKIEAGTSSPTVEVGVRIRPALKCSWSDLLQSTTVRLRWEF